MASNFLIVDDALAVTQGARALLEENGAEGEDILTAHTAAEALRLFETYRPETVLMDIDLPDRPGHELAEDLRRADPEAKIVAVTCLGPEDDRVESFLQRGGVARVPKPLEGRHLVDLGIAPEAPA